MLPRFVLDPLFRRVLRPPQRRPRALPPDMVARAEDVTIPGPRPMKAWHVRPEGSVRGTAVFVHGWSSDGGRMAPLARPLLRAGIAALLLDLPGHGRTGPAEAYHAALMVEDLRAVADHLNGARAALLGYSFGGIGAIVSAATDPRWSALVVVASAEGPMEATEVYLERKGIPARWFRRTLHRSARRLVGVDPDAFRGRAHLPSLGVPVLFVHGTDDEVVPFAHAERLFAAARPGMAELVRVEGAGHDALLTRIEAGERIAAFLAHVTF
ncbi:MAG TPA: alpha/beta fold hydrolase [Candidatus Polarisedimenticolaceae bacterium]|nr:alpha/beta fold hydrolase [Candidatus Polarisedimenticolaceae bacterium]